MCCPMPSQDLYRRRVLRTIALLTNQDTRTPRRWLMKAAAAVKGRGNASCLAAPLRTSIWESRT